MLSELIGKTIWTCSLSLDSVLIDFGDDSGICVLRNATNLEEKELHLLVGQDVTNIISLNDNKIVIQFNSFKDLIVEYNKTISSPEIFQYSSNITHTTIII